MLAQLEFTDVKKHIKQDSGLCFYIYTAEQPRQVIGSMKTYTSFGRNLPFFGYKNDSLYYFGSFSHNRWFTSHFYTLMSNSNLVQYLGIDFPNSIKPKHFKLTCDIIYKSYMEYKKRFHNDNFYVVIYPSGWEIIEYLKHYHIKTINLSGLFDLNDKRYSFIYDHHPTPLANDLLTKHLIDTINNIYAKPILNGKIK
jgi:hypothetical protein